MIDNTILQRAKDGKADAIAALMNHSLNPKGIHATAERAGDRLLVNLETDALPDQALLTKFVHQGVRNLKLATIETIMVSGRVKGSDRPAWTSTIYLDAYPDDTHPQATTSEAVSSSSVASTLEPSMGTNVGGKRAGVMPPPPPPPRSRPPVPPPPPPQPEIRQPEILRTEEPNDALVRESSDRVTSNGDLNLGDSTLKDIVTAETPDVSRNAGPVTSDSIDHAEDAPLDSVRNVSTPLYDYDVYAEDQFLSDEGDENGEANGLEIDLNDSFDAPSAPDDSDYHPFASEAEKEIVESQLSDDSRFPARRTTTSPERSSSSQTSSNPFLLGAVVLVVVGAIASLVGYSLWSYLSSGGSILDPAITPTQTDAPTGDADESDEDSQSSDDAQSESSATADDLLQEAEELATSASNVSQTAQSGDDWNLIVSRWQRAIELLEQIPESDSQYATAQQRLATYRNSLALAQQQESDRTSSASAPLPSTVISVTEPVECLSVAASANSPAVELTNVRFAEGGNTDTTQRVVGCLTNHGEAAIAGATIDYTGSSADTPDSNIDGRAELQFNNLEPGSTVAFQGDVNLPESLNNIEITSITWTFADSDTPQSVDLSLALTVD